jgi:predicted RNA-binding protein with TRAM domain
VERGDGIFKINFVAVIKKTAVGELVKTELGVALGQNAFGKRLGQLRDRRK